MNYVEQPMKRNNALAYNNAVAMELTILDCEEMGLEIERVEFDGRLRPRIFVKNSHITQKFLRDGKAYSFGTLVRHGVRRYLVQMPNRDCKILWETDRLN